MITTKHVTVDEIIRSLLSQEGKNTPHDYMMYLDIANRGLKELTFDILGNTKIALLLVSSTLKIDLPTDYVDYVNISILGDDNLLHPLGSKKNVRFTEGNARSESDDVSLLSTYGGSFGIGGGQNEHGYYKPEIDYDNWQMVLTSVYVGSYVYLEYISDGRSSDGANVIHPYAEEALRSYIYWKSIQRRRSAAMNEKESARRDYYNEKRLARARLKSFTKAEALQQIRTGVKQSPKL